MTKAILLDIEGTTTPIDFVHTILFPFAKARVSDFVRANFVSLGAEIEQLGAEYAVDESYTEVFDEESPEAVSVYLRHLIDVDRKSTPLKSIQGKIWQAGYESGELKSQIFGDVPRAFERWKSADKIIAIYSSGSVLAQKNLFQYTNYGDLTPFIYHYFDTTTGGKKESESYRKIAAELQIDPEEVLFVSDIVEELDAAREAGLRTGLSIRPGNAAIPQNPGHIAFRNFEDLEI